MKEITLKSKKNGTHKVIVDDCDFARIKKLGGKWCVCKKRNYLFVQKRLPGNNLIEMQRWITGAKKGEYVDHINHNTLDNRRSNLRICTNAANLRNGNIRINNTSGVTGVYFSKQRNKWQAQIKVMYKVIPLGRFDKKEDAIKARKVAESKYWSI